MLAVVHSSLRPRTTPWALRGAGAFHRNTTRQRAERNGPEQSTGEPPLFMALLRPWASACRISVPTHASHGRRAPRASDVFALGLLALTRSAGPRTVHVFVDVDPRLFVQEFEKWPLAKCSCTKHFS